MLTDQNKETRKTIASECFQRFQLEGEEFLEKIVTGDETWVHFFKPESKRNGITQHHRKRKNSKLCDQQGKLWRLSSGMLRV